MFPDFFFAFAVGIAIELVIIGVLVLAFKYGEWTLEKTHERGWNRTQLRGHPRNP